MQSTNTDRAEARMILDATFSEGGGWGHLRSKKSAEFAAELLCNKFGGFTSSKVLGCWKDPVTGESIWDPGIEFRCAIGTQDASAWEEFKAAAVILAWPQRSVYVVDPYGYAEVLDVPSTLVQRGDASPTAIWESVVLPGGGGGLSHPPQPSDSAGAAEGGMGWCFPPTSPGGIQVAQQEAQERDLTRSPTTGWLYQDDPAAVAELPPLLSRAVAKVETFADDVVPVLVTVLGALFIAGVLWGYIRL